MMGRLEEAGNSHLELLTATWNEPRPACQPSSRSVKSQRASEHCEGRAGGGAQRESADRRGKLPTRRLRGTADARWCCTAGRAMTRTAQGEFRMPYFTALATYFSFALLLLLGRVRDLAAWPRRWRRRRSNSYNHVTLDAKPPPPVCKGDEDFYTRRLYHRIHDCWNRPIRSAPGACIDVLRRRFADRRSHELELTGDADRCLNLGSYNYLGFASPDGLCNPSAIASLQAHGPSACASESMGCASATQRELEHELASFVRKADALVVGNGFATNSAVLPAVLGSKEGSLVVSDANNHASIVQGCRLSGARVRVFKHNDPEHLEFVLRTAITQGRPRTGRPWKKIVIAVEGLYSMEGEICKLNEIVHIAKQYKAYVFLDEAHSIGALGKTGRGVCEHCNVDPQSIDILMGTFTKSFGSCGGYVAADSHVVEQLRRHSPAPLHACAMSPPAAQQALSALRLLKGKDGEGWEGQAKLVKLKENANWLRQRLRAEGMEVLGDDDSPILPVMLYNAAKIAAFSRECLRRGVAVVVVGFPATPLLLSRTRVCVSASHTRKDLEDALDVFKNVANQLGIFYCRDSANQLDLGGTKKA